nr:ribonuclease H-like domain-containing protein [Tanacetum cinerariifolium]
MIHSNVALIGYILTGTENYKMWSTAMKIALTGKNKFGFTYGTYVKPVTSLVLSQQWERCNAIVFCWVLSSLSHDLYLGYVYSQINSKVWDELEETYDKMDGSVIFNVINKIHALKQDDLSLIRIMRFLMGLNDAYLNIKSNIIARDPLPDVEEPSMWFIGRSPIEDFILEPGIRPTFFNGDILFNLQFEKYFCAQTSSYMYNLILGWILDSGANQHLINSSKNMFNVSDISSLNLTMGHPNGTLAKNAAIGSLRLTANVVLFDVLVIPEYNDLNLVKTLGTGCEAAGLLGHPSDHVLSVLSSKIGLKYDKHVSPCDICHQAKQTREPFPLFAHKSLVVGDLVHLDLWIPYRVVSMDGFKYFLTIVNDYSRAMWSC